MRLGAARAVLELWRANHRSCASGSTPLHFGVAPQNVGVLAQCPSAIVYRLGGPHDQRPIARSNPGIAGYLHANFGPAGRVTDWGNVTRCTSGDGSERWGWPDTVLAGSFSSPITSGRGSATGCCGATGRGRRTPSPTAGDNLAAYQEMLVLRSKPCQQKLVQDEMRA